MKYIKRTKREIESENKKQEIVKVAIKLFMEYGYQKTTIADISEATGFSVGSIYNFFGNKAGILCDSSKSIYRKAAENMLLNPESLEQPKKVILRYYQEIAEEHESYGQEIAKVSMDACSEEYRSGGNLEYRNISLQAIISVLEAIEKNGRWKSKETVESVAEQIHMTFMGIILTWIYYPIHDSLVEAVEFTMPPLLDKYDL